MRILFAFVLASSLAPSLISAESVNDSSLSIRAGSFSKDLQIHFVVTDPMGRKRGHIPFPTPHELYEFPGGYGTNRLGDEVALEQANDEAIEFGHEQVLKGTYTITIYCLSSTPFSGEIITYDSNHKFNMPSPYEFKGYASSGSTTEYQIYIDPTPGAPAPVITKIVTFDVLRNNVLVAQKLNQLGDDKFAGSLAGNIDLAEKLAGVCDKRRAKKTNCEPAASVLKLFVKRLELANRKCDNPVDCDEEREWSAFRKAHGGDAEYKDFFRGWDGDGWHKHKKTCKRFVNDEAFKIIKEDAQWLIKSLGANQESGKAEGKH